MSQENKGENGLEQVIQGYNEEITKLEAHLNEVLTQSPVNQPLADSLERRLERSRDRAHNLRAMQLGAGVGSSTQSKYCIVVGCGWLCCLPLPCLSRRLTLFIGNFVDFLRTFLIVKILRR